MLKQPILISDPEKVDAAQAASKRYLALHPEAEREIPGLFWAYHELAELVPQTLEKLCSGHFFPITESYFELENSYQLALRGFYRYAFAALRFVLELGFLGFYFDVEDNAQDVIAPWYVGQARTPRMTEMLKRMKVLAGFSEFDRRFGLSMRIGNLYDDLSGYVHTRGFQYSSHGASRANFIQFSETALKLYLKAVPLVVSNVIVVAMLKYPVGMQPLPLTEKYGLNGPVGGFLEHHQVDLLTSFIAPEERKFLLGLSDGDPSVQQIIAHFESMPDLSEAEWQQQMRDFDERNPELLAAHHQRS
ncbi:MAG: hypothetical protein ACYDAG_05265 [Chloroflexota bacterium]